MPLDQNPHQTVIRFGCVCFSMYVCKFSVSQMRQFYLFTYPPRSKWASSEKMIFFFLPKSASSVSRLQAHLAKRKRIGWSIGFNSWTNWMASYQDLYAKFVSMMSPKCSIIENDGEFMFMALHTNFLPQQQYFRVYALFVAFHALVYRWEWHFLSLFSQDNENTELTVLLFFQNPYAIVAHILQHYHDFQTEVAIFPIVVQAYTLSYSLGGRIKLIIC